MGEEDMEMQLGTLSSIFINLGYELWFQMLLLPS